METIKKDQIENKAKEVADNQQDFCAKVKTKEECKDFCLEVNRQYGYNSLKVRQQYTGGKPREIEIFNEKCEEVKIYSDLEEKVVIVSFSEESPMDIYQDYKLEKKKKKFIPKDIQKQLEKDCSHKSINQISVPLRLFSPYTGFEWYIYQHIEDDVYMGFANLNDPQMSESGTISLNELASMIDNSFGMEIPLVERDRFFQTQKLDQIMKQVQGKEEKNQNKDAQLDMF